MSKNKLGICLKLVLVITECLTLLACQPAQGVNLETLDPDLYDQTWLTDKTCPTPCWKELEPGVTSRLEAISIVKQLSFIDNSGESLNGTHGASFICKKPEDSRLYCVNLSFEKGVLENLSYIPNYEITFEQAVEKLGSPDGVSVRPMYPDAGGCDLQVVWKTSKLVLQHSEGIVQFGDDLCGRIQRNKGELPRGIFVTRVQIMLPGALEALMNDSIKPWKGFSGK